MRTNSAASRKKAITTATKTTSLTEGSDGRGVGVVVRVEERAHEHDDHDGEQREPDERLESKRPTSTLAMMLMSMP